MSTNKVSPVGKMLSEVERAYIAGIIDGDGAIMACIERHQEKKFQIPSTLNPTSNLFKKE